MVDHQTSHLSLADLPAAALPRRLVAMLYDLLLLISVLAFAALMITLLSPTSGRDYNPLLTLYFLLVTYLFYGWFWTRGGQTLGMRAWRLRLQRRDGSSVDAYHALLRFSAALLSWLPCGLGYLWSLWDRDRLCWHDRLSDTVIVLIPVSAYRRE